MIMTDHPGWLRTGDDTAYRAVAVGETAVLITTTAADSAVAVDTGGSDIRFDTVDPAALSGPDDLVTPLKDAGTIVRVANPSLWDALSAAIMRQVIQAGHARIRYARFCSAYGERVTRNGLTAWLFPDPHRILALTGEQFQGVGAAFPKSALRDAARCFLAHGDRWQTLSATDLVTALQTIPRVGWWTARTAVADYTNDFSFYDYSDIAVQPAARRLNPGRDWPQGAPAFKAAWEEMAGNQLSAWTLLTLAWGINHGKPDHSVAS
jgi:DNA-3-methyladenine glycosylase II